MNNQLFLTPLITGARTDARIIYMELLARQLSVGQPVDWLERMAQQSRNNLDNYWRTALAAATAGNVQDGSLLLASFIKEWGKYKALQDLIAADASGVILDPVDPVAYDDLKQDFLLTLDNQVNALAVELVNTWLAGKAQRERDEQNGLVQGYSSLQQVNLEVIQHQGTALRQANDAALQGVQQAQQGVYWMAQFVQSHGSYMVGGMQALQNHLEQRLPSAIDQANRKRTGRLLLVVLGISGIVVALVIVACLLGPTIVQR